MIANVELKLVDPDGGGETSPTLALRFGEVRRWWIINAQASGVGGGAFARLSTNVPDLELHQIAFVLRHEDRRMMQTVDVVAPTQPRAVISSAKDGGLEDDF